MYLASLRKGSGLQVSPSFCPQREKSFSLQFLRFKGRILVTNNQNTLLLPKTCSIHALSSLLLHLLQEAKIRKTKSNKQTNWICRWYEVMQTENCFVVWKNITRSITLEQITASASGMRGYLLRITEVYWQEKKKNRKQNISSLSPDKTLRLGLHVHYVIRCCLKKHRQKSLYSTKWEKWTETLS